MRDVIRFKILEDGTVSTETEGISGQNHQSADELLENIQKMLGGSSEIKKKKGHAHHHHNEEAKHTH